MYYRVSVYRKVCFGNVNYLCLYAVQGYMKRGNGLGLYKYWTDYLDIVCHLFVNEHPS